MDLIVYDLGGLLGEEVVGSAVVADRDEGTVEVRRMVYRLVFLLTIARFSMHHLNFLLRSLTERYELFSLLE